MLETSSNDALKHCFDDENGDVEVRIGKQKINPALEKLFQQNEFLMESLYKLEQNDDLTGAEEIAKNLL